MPSSARDRGLSEIEAAALTTRVIAMHGRAEEAVAAGREALRAARTAGEPETLMRAFVNAAEALEQAGDVQAAIDLALEGVEVSRRIGAERVLGAHLKGDVAGRLLKLGRLAEAAACVQDALREGPSGVSAVMLHQVAAAVAVRRGDAEGAAAAELARAFAINAGNGMWGATIAAAERELWRGDAEQAWRIVDDVLRLADPAEYVWYSAPIYALGAWALADRTFASSSAAPRRRGRGGP